jgi:hypothetical protein
LVMPLNHLPGGAGTELGGGRMTHSDTLRLGLIMVHLELSWVAW